MPVFLRGFLGAANLPPNEVLGSRARPFQADCEGGATLLESKTKDKQGANQGQTRDKQADRGIFSKRDRVAVTCFEPGWS